MGGRAGHEGHDQGAVAAHRRWGSAQHQATASDVRPPSVIPDPTAEPVIGPRLARTGWASPALTFGKCRLCPEAVVRSRSLLILNAAAASFQDPDRVRGLSLINDLSAVITASDPSERRTKLFGIDCGRKRCEVVGFRNSAGASQNRRYEACIEIRQT